MAQVWDWLCFCVEKPKDSGSEVTVALDGQIGSSGEVDVRLPLVQSKLVAKPCTVGPIVGVAAEQSVLRLWGRGDAGPDGLTGCTAVVYILGDLGEIISTHFKRMLPEHDFITVFSIDIAEEAAFGPQGRTVHYKYGFVNHLPTERVDEGVEVSFGDIKSIATNLPPRTEASGNLRFNFGSCKYFAEFSHQGLEAAAHLGGLEALADQCFQSMYKQLIAEPVDYLFLGGDQVYADYMPGICSNSLEDYLRLYRASFVTPFHKQLMSQVPTLMAWDDHDLWNNFSNDELDDPEKKKRYAAARQACCLYQMSHSPTPTLQGPWYYGITLSKEAVLFNTDDRSERCNKTQTVYGQEQMVALKDFLLKAPAKAVKFLHLSEPLAPDFCAKDALDVIKEKAGELKKKAEALLNIHEQLYATSNDRWECYGGQRKELLEFILKNKIERVVLLGGDLHVGYHCEITCPKEPSFRVIQLVASAFCWPVPFRTQSSSTIVQGPLATLDDGKELLSTDISPIYQDCNYGRVALSNSGSKMVFELMDPHGKVEQTKVVEWS